MSDWIVESQKLWEQESQQCQRREPTPPPKQNSPPLSKQEREQKIMDRVEEITRLGTEEAWDMLMDNLD